MSDLILNDNDTISLVGTVAAPLHVDGADGITSSGRGAGYAFMDRTQAGQRWVWYAQDTRARLYTDGPGDLLTVLYNGYTGVGTAAPSRSLHVEGTEIHSGGPQGGFSFADRQCSTFVEAPANGERWLWYAASGAAHLWSGGDLLTVLHNGYTGVGTAAPSRSLHVEGTEIHSGGSQGGFSFADRQRSTFVEAPANGERWVWYATSGAAHLWSGKDHLVIGGTATQLNGDLVVTRMLSSGVLKGLDSDDGSQVAVWARDIVLEDVTVDPATDLAENTIENKISGDKPFPNRALSHMAGDKLVVNRGGGYKAGVSIEGEPGLSVEGPLTVAGGTTLLSGSVTINATGVSVKTGGHTPSDELKLSGHEVSIAPVHQAGAPSVGTWSELHLTNKGIQINIMTDKFPAGTVTSVGQISLTSAGITVAPIRQAGHVQTWTEIDITESTIIRVTNTMISGTVAKSSLDLFQVISDLQAKVASLETRLKKLENP